MSQANALDPELCLERFGLPSFRPGQLDVISAVLAGRDCMCIMPTGGGKSLCYQLPSIAREGVTLVISPLIALMKDQVDSLIARGIPATCINSSLSVGEQQSRLQQMAEGKYDMVYVAPERLRNQRFLDAVRGARVQLLAVDEAHCVSEWGHDFRPDYARLGRFRKRLGNPQTIALTATATSDVRDDVAQMLKLHDPEIFVSGFARDNLSFEVLDVANGREKDARLLDFLREMPGAGIVYASSRKRCEEVRELISDRLKRTVGVYHAGLMPNDRRQVQEDFMADRVQIIVATNAFGMGIDKSDLRFVVHYNMPGSLEAYYQEAGRAGRDGKPSRCLLLYTYQDRYIQEFFIENAYPTREMVAAVYEYLRSIDDDPIEITLEDLKERLELTIGSDGVGACERMLEKCGALERMDSVENKASVKLDSDLPTLVDLLPRDAKVRRKVLQALEREVDERRWERVYFHPQRIAAAAGLERDAVLRTLRELNKLQAFDYVPAFRGRAVHMMKRDVPFDKLNIDFEELAARRQAEYDKLDRVIQFARTRRCRQLEILVYFGDPDRRVCGRCDNCVRSGVKTDASTSDSVSAEFHAAIIKAARIVLSGVARAQGKFGKNVVAQMLCGSKAAKIAKFHLDQLSTFGLLNQLTQIEVVEILDALLACRLLEQTDVERHRPVLRLSEDGDAVMRAKAALPASFTLSPEITRKLTGSSKQPGGTESSPGIDDFDAAALDPGLERELRDWRRETAESRGWAAYRVLTNATLERVATVKPANRTELLEIKGIGDFTAKQFGKKILAIVAKYRDVKPAPTESVKPRVDDSVQEEKTDYFDTDEADFADAHDGDSIAAAVDNPAVGSTVSTDPEPIPLPEVVQAVEKVKAGSEHNADDAIPLPDAVQAMEKNRIKPEFYWTWRLLWDGFTADQCREIRRLDEQQLILHLLQALDQQFPVAPAWVFQPHELVRLGEAVGDTPPRRLRPLLDQLPADIRREHLQLYLRCQGVHC